MGISPASGAAYEKSAATLQAGFKLNDYVISPTTGEVWLPDRVVTLEPKVMQVLLALTLAAGKVISAEQLFAQVWPTSIYSPVSVRRSVNQLRKVFNDADKVFIKTHPKLGYSLHANIALIDALKPLPDQRSTLLPGKARRGNYLALFGAAVICAALLLFKPWQAGQQWHVTALQPLTATAAQASYSIFTPDGRAVLYVTKNADQQPGSELWLTSTDRAETRLVYQSDTSIEFFSWVPASGDNTAPRQLLLASSQADAVRFFSLYLSGDYQLLTSVEHFQLTGSQSVSPFFSTASQVFFLARHAAEHRLYQADLSTGQVDLLLSPSQQFSTYRIAPAAAPDTITLLGFDQQRRSQIKLLSTTTGEITDLATLDANWYFIVYSKPFGGYLLSDGKGLFLLNKQQQLTKLTFENYAFLHFPGLSPSGSQLTYTQAKINGNIHSASLPANEVNQLTHSTMHDWQGSYSPDNSQVAYVSNKHGHSQVFVLDIASATERLVYANSEQHLALSQPVWAENGTQLAFARNERLVTVNLAGNTPIIQHFDQVIGQPSQWLAPTNEVLIRQASQPFTRWYRFSLSTGKQQQVAASNNTPQVLHNGQPLQISQQYVQDAEGTPLFTVTGGYHISQHFAKPNGIYLLLQQQQATQANAEVWFFDYARQTGEKISAIHLADQDISDISQQQLLYSSFKVEKNIHTLTLTKQ